MSYPIDFARETRSNDTLTPKTVIFIRILAARENQKPQSWNSEDCNWPFVILRFQHVMGVIAARRS
jgi:hypothetical protein